eukprot:3941101-Rhodomonas_salina.3
MASVRPLPPDLLPGSHPDLLPGSHPDLLPGSHATHTHSPHRLARASSDSQRGARQKFQTFGRRSEADADRVGACVGHVCGSRAQVLSQLGRFLARSGQNLASIQ